MGALLSLANQQGPMALAALILLFLMNQLFQIIMKYFDNHRASQKNLIEKADYSEHFFENIAGKKIQTIVRERAIQALTGCSNIEIHELEYFLHLEKIDGRVQKFSKVKNFLWIDEQQPINKMLQFLDKLQSNDSRSKFKRKSYALYFLFGFLGIYGFLFIVDPSYTNMVSVKLLVGFLSTISVFCAGGCLWQDEKLDRAIALHKEIQAYWQSKDESLKVDHSVTLCQDDSDIKPKITDTKND
jgi:hypothetical protein